jgi:CheY-like chemotaxis protein
MPMPNILVVDDNIEFLRALTTFLGKRGFVVAGAANPAAVIDYLTNDHKRFDLVITDLSMPQMDGMAVLRKLKTEFPKLPVIILSAYGTADTQQQALRAGAFAYLSKPLDKDQFLSVVDQAIGQTTRGSSVED